MKKLISVLLALVICFALPMLSVSAAVTDPNTVGSLGREVYLAPGFTQEDLPVVQSLIRREYNRGIQTRSIKHQGKAYFNYGQSTGEFVHAFVGTERTTEEGVVLPAAACMNQDFTGGYSDCLATMGMDNNWCCILVTPESLKKGEAYTVRDGIGNAWGNAGATNSYWGLPTGNQYWIGDTCYQTFEYGYAAAERASIIFVNFFTYEEGNVAPAVPNAAAYDHYTDVQPEEGPQPSIEMEPSDLSGDLDGDGKVTVSDVVTLRQLIVGGESSAAQLACGDLTEDGQLSVSDVVELRSVIVGGNIKA
ncbi:MAG: dockerin type I domain-containing protein [Candidatus Howiella sp.]|jgi:hypothetical protein